MKKQAFLCVIFAGVLWGTSGIFVKLLAPFGYSSWQMTAIRALGAVLGMGLVLLFRDRSLFRVGWGELLLSIGLGIFMFATSALYFTALQVTSIAVAEVLMYTAPVMVMIFSVIFFKEKMTFLKGVAVVCMLIGCALVAGIVGGVQFEPLGILIAFLSGVAYAIYNIFAKLAMSRGYRPLSTTFYTFLFMAVSAFFFAKPWELPTRLSATPSWGILLLVCVGPFTAMIPYFLYNLAMKALPAGTVSAMGILEPMSGAVFGMILFHEKMTVFSAIGIVLILGSVFLLSRAEDGGHRKKKEKTNEKVNELSRNF